MRSIQKSTCTLHHAWVWSIPATSPNYVNLEGSFELADEWLTYIWASLETQELYLPVKRNETWSFSIAAPPHYMQEWAMTIEPYSKATEDYLASHLGNEYYWTNGVFFTQKETHSASDTDDEVATYVKASMAMFDNNAAMMKQAAEAGGLTNGYKIIWRNLRATEAGSDYEYEVKMN